MTYFSFAKANRKVITFGLVLNFFSNFGQTYFISLFVPFFLVSFSITETEFGFLYSFATIISGIAITFIGKQIDHFPLNRFAMAITVGLIISTLLISVSYNLVLFFIGLMCLRLFGQGLLSLTAQTTMARAFDFARGKALSLATLGFPLGEAIFPTIILFLLGLFQWKWVWLLITVFILITLPFYIVKFSSDAVIADKKARKKDQNNLHSITQLSLFKDSGYLLLLPAIISTPFVMTGFLLYQLSIAEYKGWSTELIAYSFVGFALSRILFSLITGPLIDRFSAKSLFIYHLIPLLLGVYFLTLGSMIYLSPIWLFLAGTTLGFGGNIKTAMWAELYGVAKLGAVKSLTASITILSTSLSPFLMGWLLENPNFTIDVILYYTTLLILASILIAIPGIIIFNRRSIDKSV